MELSDFQEFEINNPSTIQLIGLNIQAYKNAENTENTENNPARSRNVPETMFP